MKMVCALGAAACFGASAIAAPLDFQNAVSASAPALWYKLGESAGVAANSGSLGSAFDMAVSASVQRGIATAAGETGMRFTSPADFLQTTGVSTLTGNPTFTIEAIVRLEGANAALWGPMLHWGSSTTGTAAYFGISSGNNNRVYAGFYNAGVRTASAITTDVWLHVVWVRQGGTDSTAGSTLYINGCPVTLQQDPGLAPGVLAPGAINVAAGPFQVNRAADFNTTRTFRGTLDELVLYTRALPQSEIAQHAAASGLVCYANCDCSVTPPILNALDFSCFLTRYTAGDPYANCDGSTIAPALNALDFSCFLSRYRAGCP